MPAITGPRPIVLEKLNDRSRDHLKQRMEAKGADKVVLDGAEFQLQKNNGETVETIKLQLEPQQLRNIGIEISESAASSSQDIRQQEQASARSAVADEATFYATLDDGLN